MKMKKYLGLILGLFLTASGSAQILIGSQTQSPTTGTVTVTVGGTGTGTVVSLDTPPSINCPGTCSATLPLNTVLSVLATPTGGSTFVGYSGQCGGTDPICTVTVLGNVSESANFAAAGGGGGTLITSWPGFAIDPNQSNHWPGPVPITTGGGRVWDTPNSQWVWFQILPCTSPFPCSGSYSFNTPSGNSLDTLLGLMKAAGVDNAYMPMSRTPGTESSWQNGANTSASSCGQDGTPKNQFGECYPPLHLNADGSGSDQEWIDWVTAEATHVHAAGYGTTHAVLTAWETWNEPDTGCTLFYCGDYDQTVRNQEDLYFLIKGDANFTFTGIATSGTTGNYTGTFPLCASNYCAGMRVNVTGLTGGNNVTGAIVCNSTSGQLSLGTAATIVGGAQGALVTNACTRLTTVNGDTGGTLRFVETFKDAGNVYRTAEQVQAAAHSSTFTYGLSNNGALNAPVSPTDTVFMGSFHGPSTSLTKANIWLYCNGGSTSPADPNQTKCANPSNAGSIFSDAMNWHMKPGCSAGANFQGFASPELLLDSWMSGVQAMLSSVDLAKPFWETEGGFGQWQTCTTGPAGQPQDYTDPLMKASFMGRYNVYKIIEWNNANLTWYNDSSSHTGTGSAQADAALNNVYGWLQGGRYTPGACSTLSPGTAGTNNFTYQCPYTDAAGNADVIVWDNSQSCTNPVCTTTSQAVSRFSGGPYTHYDTLVDNAPHNISGGVVPVGITPIRLRP